MIYLHIRFHFLVSSSLIYSEVASAIGKDNLQKCYDVMANVQDEELVKVSSLFKLCSHRL